MRNQFTLDLNSEIFVDGFAGGGGASTGILMALNRHVDHAFNHAWDALGMHRINHPQTVHHCEDIFDVDPWEVADGRPVGGGWFSPDCKHFSKAKGGKPRDKRIRGLMFSIFRWAKIGTRVLYMENVEEIQTAGPLLGNGMPDPKHKGRTFKAFVDALGAGVAADHPDIPEMVDVLTVWCPVCEGDKKKVAECAHCQGTGKDPEADPRMHVTKEDLVRGFGYHVETREIRAYVYGSATIRKRLYLIARCDGMPIVWPEPTHGDPSDAETRAKKLKPWKTIAECIDWDIPCKSIFLTPAEAKALRCRRPLAKSTLRRIATGVDRFVLKAKKPFLVNLTHQGSDRVEPVDEPPRTTTAAHRGEKAVVAPTVVSAANSKTTGRGRHAWGAEEPLRTVTTSPSFARVDAELVAPLISEHANASNEPGRTQCAEVKGGHFSLVGASLVHTAHGERDKNGKKRGRESHCVTEPMPSVLASSDCALVAAHMVQNGHLKSNSKMVKGVDEPMRTQVARSEHGVVAASLTKFTTRSVGQPAEEPIATIPAGSHSEDTHGGAATVHGLITADIVKLRGTNVGSGVEEPMHTASAGGNHHGLVATYLAQHNGGFNETPGHSVEEPCSTISSKGSQQQVVTGTLAAYYGNDEDGQAVDEPARTVTTKERFGFVKSEAVTPGLTEEQLAGALRVARFLREHGVQFEGEFATVAGYVIVDIGMRMLTARELFRAQGFPDEYVIDRAWIVDPATGGIKEVALTKEQQIRMCGNSVCPQVAAALVRANSGDMAVMERRMKKGKSEVGFRNAELLKSKVLTGALEL